MKGPCVSVIVDVEGEDYEICLSHVPGNESLTTTGQTPQPSINDVKRALAHATTHRVRRPTISLSDMEDI